VEPGNVRFSIAAQVWQKDFLGFRTKKNFRENVKILMALN
jgi:hypothetical protein